MPTISGKLGNGILGGDGNDDILIGGFGDDRLDGEFGSTWRVSPSLPAAGCHVILQVCTHPDSGDCDEAVLG